MEFRDLEKIVIADLWIEEYRREHIARAFEVRLKGGLIKPRHPHRNHPYCNICDEDYEEWDLGYRLYVGGRPVVYHVDCIEANWDTRKVKNIVDQDRGFRKRMEGERKTTNELTVRAQLYKFIIGSVLGDASGETPWPGSDRLSNLRPLTPVIDGEKATTTPGVDVNAETGDKSALHMVAEELR